MAGVAQYTLCEVGLKIRAFSTRLQEMPHNPRLIISGYILNGLQSFIMNVRIFGELESPK